MSAKYLYKLLPMIVFMLPLFELSAAENDCPDTLNFSKRTLAGEQKINLCEAYLGKVVMAPA